MPPKTTVPLFAWTHKSSRQMRYAVEGQSPGADYERDPRPLCRVWKYPLSPAIDFAE